MQPSDTLPLVALTRGGVNELLYRGAYVVVTNRGETVHAYGNPHLVTFLRSSAKPFQALPLIERGAASRFGLATSEIAVAAASHSGESVHVETVRALLGKADVPETALQCGAHLPLEQESAYALIRRNALPTAIHSNCSGKHAGMLVAAKTAGEPLDTYLDYDHPLQKRILDGLAGLAETPVTEIPVSRDGCGAPIFALPLERLALLFAKLASPVGMAPERANALRTICSAMMAHPYLVAGRGRLDARLMESRPGKVVVKSGAAGVYGVGLPELGLGIALKVEDGDGVTRCATAIQALRRVAGEHIGHDVLDALWSEFCPVQRNLRGELVGEVRWLGD
jgi:L-asparaginase II